MPQGDKLSYADQQKRQADHIETGCEKKEFSTKTTEGWVWAWSRETAGVVKYSGSGRCRNKKECLVVCFSRKPVVFTLQLGNAH